MTRLITLVMGMMVLAFTAFATPNPMTAPTNNSANNGETSFNSAAVPSSSKIDVSSEINGMLNSYTATNSLVAHSTDFNNALADVTFSVSSPTADVGDQVCVDFSVTGFTDIVSIQYSMNWDETKLSYVTSQNYNLTDLNGSAFGTAGTVNGDLTLSWFHNATTGVTLPDGAVIYQVCFDVLAAAEGQSVAVGLSGIPTSIEVTDNTFAVQNFINQDGAVVVSGSPPPPPASGIIFNVASSTADAGTQTCLDVSVEGFTDIVSFQYSMNWDENTLGYASVQNFNLTDLNVSAFGTAGTTSGDLTASWIHQATTGVTVPDGTVIYQVCFDVLAGTEGQTAAVSLSGAPTSIEVTDNTNAVVDFSNNNGQVSVNGTPPPPSSGVTFSVSSSTVDAGAQTCLDVSVEGFTNIVSFQYSMNWDENVLDYASAQNFNLTDLNVSAFGTAGTTSGDLTASWIHQATTGVTVPDGTVIYQVCFDAIAGTEGQTATVNLSGSPTSIEVTDNTNAVIDFSNNAGQISVNGTPPPPSSGVTFNVSSSTADAGAQTCLDVSVEGFTNIVSFQYSMNWDENVLDYASAQNFNLTDLNAAAFGTSGTANGNLTASWIHQATTGVTVPDGTVIYQVCFDVAAGTDGQTATVGLSGTPTSIEVTDNTNAVLDFSNNSGQVVVNDNGGGGPNTSVLAFIVEEVIADNGTQVCMDVSVEGFNDIVSAQYSMNWDESVLTFASVQNYNLTDLNEAAFGTSGTNAGNLTLSWIHQATTGVTVPDGTVIYQVCFDVNGTDGQTVGVSISGAPTSIEITDNTSSVITPVINSGQITVQGDSGTGNGNLTFTIEDLDAEVNEMVCLDVTVESFTNIVSAQYSMNWNPAQLEFASVQGFNLTDLNDAAFGTSGVSSGDLTMSWIHQATTGVTVPDGTVIYEVCFTVLSNVGSTPLVSISGAPTSIEVTDNTSSVIPFFSNPGQVTVVTGGGGGGNTDLVFNMESETIAAGTNVCLDVTVDNFDAIVSAQYSINWDPTALSYTGIQGFNLTDLNESSFGILGVANGNLTSSWFHQATTGVTLPAGTVIYQVCFDALGADGSSSSVSFSGNPTSIEVTTTGSQIVPFTSTAGGVTLEGGTTPTQNNADLTFTVESETAEAGDNICLDVTVDDFVDIVSAQYSMTWNTDILDFTGIQGFNLTDLNEPDFGQGSVDGGVLTLSWIHEATTGVTVPNGTVIYQVCFDVVGSSGNITGVAIGGVPTSIEVTSNTSGGQDIDAEYNAGNVTVEGEVVTEDVVFQYECTDGAPGDIICIPVSTQNFTNLVTFQYSMHWNNNILSYQNVQGFNLPNLNANAFGAGNAANGTLGVVWEDQSSVGIDRADEDILFEICFEIIGDIGQSTLMTFDGFPTAVEVTDATAAELPVTFLQCAVNVVNNCPVATITQNSISNVSCQGENNGAIEVTVTGGNDTYTYEWVNNDSGTVLSSEEDIEGLSAGNYVLNVTTCSGAEVVSQTFQVTEPATSISISEVVEVVTCFDGQDGAISVTGQGGTGALTYNWAGGNLPANTNGANLSGLMASTYSLTVTDANQCVMNESFTVAQPASAFVANATITDVSCNGAADGAIELTAEGGWGNYQYTWTDGLSGTNPQSLSAGMYSVTIEDQEGCEQMVSGIEVTEPGSVGITGMITDVATDSPGEINITPEGGSGAGTYTYQWSGPDSYSAVTEDLNDLSIGGEYCVTVTDVNSCTDAQCFTINSPLLVEINEVQFSCAGASNGFINISAFGGQGTITYSWTGPGSYISADEDITGLAGGTYSILVTDENGSSDTQTVELTEAADAVSVSPVVTQLSADDVCDGTINASGATGGFGGYTFLWNTVDAATTPTVTNLCAGTYTVTVTDSEGCSTTSTTTIQYIPEILFAEASTSSALCFGECNGSVTIDILTGIAPFTIEVLDAAGETLASGLDSDGTETFGNLCAQSVLVSITDAAGQMMEITSLLIDEPVALSIISSTIFPVTIAAGNNGAISVEVEGGTGEYTYDWEPGSNDQNNVNLSAGSYFVEVTDENGCSMTSEIFQLELFEVSNLTVDDADCVGDANGEVCATVSGGNGEYSYLWSSGEMTNCITGKEAGNYSVTITDVASGVSISQSVDIETQSFLTATAAPSTLFAGGANISCAGRADGAATANSQGGMNTVTYAWSNGTNSQAISNVPAGIYTVTATDEIGCISTASVTIVEPEPFTATLAVEGISCNGQRDGLITASAIGGANTTVEEYDYEWTGTGIINAFLPTVNNLTEGLYTVNITDPNGCETTATTELVEPAILEVTTETTADDGSQNGTAIATVTGGTEDYSYEWRSNGEVGSTQELTGLAAGSYMLFVTDANGCETMQTDIIVQDNSLGCLDTRLVISPFSSPGVNDEFVINCIENFEENNLEIYNRWGQLVYAQENYDCGTDDCPNGWKGTNLRDAELAGGGYFYVLEYEEQGVLKQLKGSITILKE